MRRPFNNNKQNTFFVIFFFWSRHFWLYELHVIALMVFYAGQLRSHLYNRNPGRPLKHSYAKRPAHTENQMVTLNDTSSRMRVMLIRNNVRATHQKLHAFALKTTLI